MRAGKWFHRRLADVTTRLAGIDINQEAIAHLSTLGIPDLHCLDVTNAELPPVIAAQRWDSLVLGELLEHVGDPATFLDAIKQRFSPMVETLVVSVPNAFRLANFEQAKNRVELSNSDHRHYYSPYTLARTLSASGFTPREIFFCVYEIPTLSCRAFLPQHRWKSRMKRYPLLRDVIVMTADMARR
jgi:2-polyprenyl-3-methyl-5-hydroxy-6-metoxy-1,4-benzoquinol methylase